jgi:hypothetical protein
MERSDEALADSSGQLFQRRENNSNGPAGHWPRTELSVVMKG